MESLNGFNWISGVYDRAARVVFGKAILNAQLTFLDDIPINCKILILGGGTGRILEEMIRVNPRRAIWYIDASSAMLERAKERLRELPAHDVHFLHGTVNSIPGEIKFDVVITNFFLDLFTVQSLVGIMEKIDKALLTESLWLVTDFVNGKKLYQRLLLYAMYLFFRITSKLEARKLPPWEAMLKKWGFKKLKSALFFNAFIKSAVFIKTDIN